MSITVTTLLKAIFLVAGLLLAVPGRAKSVLPRPDDSLQALYAEAFRNAANSRGPILADSLRRLARAAGNREYELRALNVMMKHEYVRPGDNFAGLDRAVGALMDQALKYGDTEYFYSAVSHKMTYLTNRGDYAQALDYQNRMLEFAKSHGHSYGIILGHISLGNLYRKRLQVAQAVDEYRQAIDGYGKYHIKHDLGLDYKRIAECYTIVGHFEKVLETVETGLDNTADEARESGLYGYRAFALFMLGCDSEFREAYALYSQPRAVAPDILPFVARCLEVMRRIDEGRDAEVEAMLRQPGMGAFMPYVDIAYNKRKKRYPQVLEAMRSLNASLYGDSKGSFTADWARMSAEINNNLAEMDRQRAENANSRLELANTNLKLRNTELELSRARDAERLALMTAETKQLSNNNQQLLSQQLADSLARLELHHEAQRVAARSERVTFATMLGVIAVLMVLACLYLWRTNRMAASLKLANGSLRRTLDDLSVANDKAQESDREKTRFIQNMSHEIRTPLNAIVGFSQVLADNDYRLAGDERERIVQIVNANSDVLNKLINDILDLTRIESGKYVVKMDHVCVNSLCRLAVDSTRMGKGDHVRMGLKTDLPDEYSVLTDEHCVLQVLVNLLTNATKNTNEGNITLSCSLTERPGMVTFAVTDTGIGIPEDKREAIFGRFCKLDPFKQGAGLGLDICRVIAAKLGGDMGLDTGYTNGARFWFAIPNQR